MKLDKENKALKTKVEELTEELQTVSQKLIGAEDRVTELEGQLAAKAK